MYYFMTYIQSPASTYFTAEKRRVYKKELETILPTIGIAYIVPTVAMFAVPGLVNKQWINGVFFQPFPLYAVVVQRVLGSFVKDSEVKMKVDENVADTEEEIKDLRHIYALSAAASASVYLYLWIMSPFPMKGIFFSNLSNPSAEHTMLYGAAKVLRYDHLSCFGAGAVWTMLNFWDLKQEGLLKAGWLNIVSVFAGVTVLGGPGAAMAGMWGWRETILRKKTAEPFESTPHMAD
jgi:hypothetical protein